MATKLQQEYIWAQYHLPPVLPGMQPYPNSAQTTLATTTIFVGWLKPHLDWIKINTDGAARGYPRIAGADVVCRNEEAATILAISQPLGITTALAAETWAMLIASRAAMERGWPKVQFETDSENLTRFLTTDAEAPWYISNQIAEIKYRFTQIQQYTIRHVYREGNQAADALANRAADDCSIGKLATTM